jgi:hypothetical protein
MSELPPELAGPALLGLAVEEAVAEARRALQSGMAGEPRHLLRLPYGIGDRLDPFELVAAAATELAVTIDDLDQGDALNRLAADLIATEARCRALNLARDRQLVGCLLRWYRQLGS